MWDNDGYLISLGRIPEMIKGHDPQIAFAKLRKEITDLNEAGGNIDNQITYHKEMIKTLEEKLDEMFEADEDVCLCSYYKEMKNHKKILKKLEGQKVAVDAVHGRKTEQQYHPLLLRSAGGEVGINVDDILVEDFDLNEILEHFEHVDAGGRLVRHTADDGTAAIEPGTTFTYCNGTMPIVSVVVCSVKEEELEEGEEGPLYRCLTAYDADLYDLINDAVSDGENNDLFEEDSYRLKDMSRFKDFSNTMAIPYNGRKYSKNTIANAIAKEPTLENPIRGKEVRKEILKYIYDTYDERVRTNLAYHLVLEKVAKVGCIDQNPDMTSGQD